MTLFSILPFAAALFSLPLAIASVLRKKRSPAAWWFLAGMGVLGLDSLFTGLSLHATHLPDALRWLALGFIAKSFVPAAWLGFSLRYARGDYRDALVRWRIPLAVIGLLPIALAALSRGRLLEIVPPQAAGEVLELRVSAVARLYNVTLLLAAVLILMNLEQTFRSAVGTMRWRIKFVVVGLAVVFGAQVYARSQAILFSRYDLAFSGVESSALLIGCFFLALAHMRSGFAEIDVYPSRAVLRSSLTVVIAGGYLFIVGSLALIVRSFGGADRFQLAAFVVLVGMAGLAMLLLSERLRQRIHDFVARHFGKATHDALQIWTGFSRRLNDVKDPGGLCAASARFISETFNVLSVTVWLLDEETQQITLAGTTASGPAQSTGDDSTSTGYGAIAAGLLARASPFDLEQVNEPWGEELRQLNSMTFRTGGDRWCVPLHAGDQRLGAVVLADRVNAANYTVEEREMLQCIADQLTAGLLNLRLANEVARGRELEAFRTMSAFFVHDLKNAASSLNLMLKNLPVHFDDPAFREDLLRGIGNTARRIEETIARLSALRQRPDFKPLEADLNQLVSEAVERLDGMPHVSVTTNLHPVPRILADREQIQSVVTNLLLNARDAIGAEGCIQVRTDRREGRVVLSVADNGCGMTPAFLKESLFRPFQSTKRKGLGIGMFQSRMIVEAHGGSIQVESERGKGSTFRVSLPAGDAK